VSLRKILIAVDEQPASVRAGEVGAELARSLGGEVALIHIGDPGFMGDTGMSPAAVTISTRSRATAASIPSIGRKFAVYWAPR